MSIDSEVKKPAEVAGAAKAGEEGASTGRIIPITIEHPTVLSRQQILVEADCIFGNIDDAVEANVAAQLVFADLPLSGRKNIIESMRAAGRRFAHDFALCAWSETRRGRYSDKLQKQLLACNATPGVEDIKPECYTGDYGMTTIDLAPYGVIGAVTPVTNPTATIINNCITILAGGNGVVFNPHPGATACTNRAVAVMNQAIMDAGGPPNLVTTVRTPTIASGQRLLTHPKTTCNLVTGGPAVVKVAMASGKKSFCAGPGNPPVVVDETAEIEVAAKGIYDGASFDNNMICSDEKEIFCVEDVFDKLIEALRDLGAYIATPEDTEKLTNVCIPEAREDWSHGFVDKDLVGQNADVILKKIGITVPESCRLAICEVHAGHPLVWTEQLMPVIPVIKCKDFEEALALAYKAEYGFKHTSSIYSSNLHHISDMAKKMNTTLFIVNGAHTCGLASGGEGYTSFSIAGATGEGMTRPRTFVRERRLVCKDSLRFI